MKNPLRDPDRHEIMKVKSRVAKVLTKPVVGQLADRVFGGCIPSARVRIDTRSPAITDSSRAQLLWGIYEGAEQRLVRKHLDFTDTIVELGTSIGFVSSVAAKTTRPRRIIGVEANPDLLELAELNIRRNAPNVDITVIHGAINYEVDPGAPVGFAVEDQHTGARSAESPNHTSFFAPAVRLRDILSEFEVGEFTLLSDVEGAEAGVLFNDTMALSQCRQAVIELHSTDYRGQRLSVEDLQEAIVRAGFAIKETYGAVAAITR